MIDRLWVAAGKGNIALVKDILTTRNININDRHSIYGTPPITQAVKKGQIEIVKLLARYGADLLFHVPFNETPLMISALESKKCQAMIDCLVELGLKFNPNEIYKIEIFKISMLAEIVEHQQWDFLLCILKNHLQTLNLDLLGFPGSKDTTKAMFLIFQLPDNSLKHDILTYFFTNIILKSKTPTFNALKLELGSIQATLSKHYDATGCFTRTLTNLISLFTTIKTEIGKILSLAHYFSHPDNLNFDIAGEFWQDVTKKVVSSYLPPMQDKDINDLITLFIRLDKTLSQEQDLRFNKLAKLSFQEWRHHHQHLFLFKKPKKAAALGNYEFLEACFKEKLSGLHLTLALRNSIIANIAKLNHAQFNKPEVLQAIDYALKP